MKDNGFYVYNPNNFSFDTDFNHPNLRYFSTPEKQIEEGSTNITDIVGCLFSFSVPMIAPEINISTTLKITISGNDPGDFPQKIWKIIPGRLYTKDTPSDTDFHLKMDFLPVQSQELSSHVL